VSFTQTLVAGLVAGFVTGCLALSGVVIASKRAATAAAQADARRAVAMEATDKRRDDADYRRWSRDKRVTVYSEHMSNVDVQRDKATELWVNRRVRSDASTELRIKAELQASSGPVSRSYDAVAILSSYDVRRAFEALNAAARELVKVSKQAPLPTEEVFDAAQTRCSEAYRHLLPEIKRELGLVPQEIDG
jgi:hypothetical protein